MWNIRNIKTDFYCRFTAIHGQGSNNWALKVELILLQTKFTEISKQVKKKKQILKLSFPQIVNPNMDDAGLYECQVSYHDDTEKKLKMPFSLKVLGKCFFLVCHLRK